MSEDQEQSNNQSQNLQNRIIGFIDAWIFPGKLFPCFRNRIGGNGEVLPPPTISDLLRYEADNAKARMDLVSKSFFGDRLL